MFIIDTAQPSATHIEIGLVSRNMVDVINLASNLNTRVRGWQTGDEKLQTQFEVFEFGRLLVGTSEYQPSVLIERFTLRYFAYDIALFDSPVVGIPFPSFERFPIKNRMRFSSECDTSCR